MACPNNKFHWIHYLYFSNTYSILLLLSHVHVHQSYSFDFETATRNLIVLNKLILLNALLENLDYMCKVLFNLTSMLNILYSMLIFIS